MIDEDKLNALELFGENEYLHKEIERLNNIINSLNGYLVRCLTIDMEWTYHLAIKETYEYLQELKENK